MYENFFNEFEYADAASPYCIIKLKYPAFNGVEVTIGKQFTVTAGNEIKFDWEVSAIPEGFDKNKIDTLEFTDLVKGIFLAVLENQLQVYAQPKDITGEAPEGSIPPGPETEREG